MLRWIKIALAIIGSFLFGWFFRMMQKPPASLSSPEEKEEVDVDEVVAEDEAMWEEVEEKLKERDREKIISGIINDAGGVINGQRVTVQRDGYFDITKKDSR